MNISRFPRELFMIDNHYRIIISSNSLGASIIVSGCVFFSPSSGYISFKGREILKQR